MRSVQFLASINFIISEIFCVFSGLSLFVLYIFQSNELSKIYKDDGFRNTTYTLVNATDHKLFVNLLVHLPGPTNPSDVKPHFLQVLAPLKEFYGDLWFKFGIERNSTSFKRRNKRKRKRRRRKKKRRKAWTACITVWILKLTYVSLHSHKCVPIYPDTQLGEGTGRRLKI